MKHEYSVNETIERLSKCIEDMYDPSDANMRKVFYRINEWYGWRFWLKAFRHLDWRSIWGHLKANIIRKSD